MKTIHPAIAEHVMEENERLRGLLAQVRVSLNLDDTEYGFSKDEKRSMVYRIDAAISPQTEPCGGCGNADESKRCIGCAHPFSKHVAMCETMQRPKAECGCPDCGSSLIDWPKAEPAPAQDERRDWTAALLQVVVVLEALKSRDSRERLENMDAGKVLGEAYAKLKRIRATRPAQTEQQPIYQIRPRENVRDWCDVNVDGYRAAQAMASMETRKLYVAPVAQPAQTELVEALRSFVSLSEQRLHELGELSPEMTECLRRGRAALAAQGGRDE